MPARYIGLTDAEASPVGGKPGQAGAVELYELRLISSPGGFGRRVDVCVGFKLIPGGGPKLALTDAEGGAGAWAIQGCGLISASRTARTMPLDSPLIRYCGSPDGVSGISCMTS